MPKFNVRFIEQVESIVEVEAATEREALSVVQEGQWTEIPEQVAVLDREATEAEQIEA